MKHIITTDSIHIFKDDNGNVHKIGVAIGTVEQALNVLLNPPVPIPLTYRQLREQEYLKQGLTPDYFAICLIQKELDNDVTMLNDYKAKRLAIKSLYLKR